MLLELFGIAKGLTDLSNSIKTIKETAEESKRSQIEGQLELKRLDAEIQAEKDRHQRKLAQMEADFEEEQRQRKEQFAKQMADLHAKWDPIIAQSEANIKEFDEKYGHLKRD